MRGDIPPLPQKSSWRGAQLKHRENFTFNLLNICTKMYQSKVEVNVTRYEDVLRERRYGVTHS
jgi:hypothetical protein